MFDVSILTVLFRDVSNSSNKTSFLHNDKFSLIPISLCMMHFNVSRVGIPDWVGFFYTSAAKLLIHEMGHMHVVNSAIDDV